MSYDAKAAELGLELPPAAAPIANYIPAVRTGNLVFLSGHGPVGPDGLVRGKLGADLSIEEGVAAARLVMIGLLGSLKSELGSLDKVQRIVKLLCMVNCTPDFGDPPKVANGASDLLVELFGDAGKHARSAVGMNSLPMGMAVEIEMIVEVAD
jgi:enamine deaminase RidA (YjgF/YER057c/UK114 family)